MFKFKIGDIVKVHREVSESSGRLDGQIGKITNWERDERGEYGNLDIEGDDNSGLWAAELELVERKPKEIKVFGIVKFLDDIKGGRDV